MTLWETLECNRNGHLTYCARLKPLEKIMELEFNCGVVANNVGELVMALRYHLTICTVEACRADVEESIIKYGRRK